MKIHWDSIPWYWSVTASLLFRELDSMKFTILLCVLLVTPFAAPPSLAAPPAANHPTSGNPSAGSPSKGNPASKNSDDDNSDDDNSDDDNADDKGGAEKDTSKTNTNRRNSAEDRIRGALESGEPGEASGILGDVLDVIRRRGSILDGSILDPKNSDPLNLGHDGTQSGRPNVPNDSPTKTHSKVNVAESLLRSARLLESLPGGNEDRDLLIKKMRCEATRLLIELFPQ
jgi:hypothetical protein